MEYIHRKDKIASFEPLSEMTMHLIPNHDNTSVVLIERCISGSIRSALTFRDIVREQWSESSREVCAWSLSFDGSKFAYVKKEYSQAGSFTCSVYINGEKRYTGADNFYIYRFKWLDNDRLAWSGWFEDEEGKLVQDEERYYFINGERVEDQGFFFEPVWGARGTHNIIAQENGKRFVIMEDGSRAFERDTCCNSSIHCRCNRENRTRPVQPEEHRDERTGRVQVSFNGVTGPEIDGVSSGSHQSYAFSADRSRVAYVAEVYPSVSRSTYGFLGKVIEAAESNKALQVLAYPFVFLFNPYTGPGYMALEESKRYVPVDHGKPWAKKYTYAHDQFYTAASDLVVTAHQHDKQCVVINGDEGPLFDAIEHVIELKDENAICYLGRNGGEVFRVIAKR